MKSKLLVVLLVGACALAAYKMHFLKPTPGNVILLDGTSSVGKSAIIAEFKKLNPDYAVIKVDDWYPADLMAEAQSHGWRKESGVDAWTFVRDFVNKKNGHCCLDTQVRGEIFGNCEKRGYLEEAKKQAVAGHHVIIDTVLEDAKQYEIFRETFKNLSAKKVLVYCPLSILLARVAARNASSDASEHRTAFLSFEQFPVLYKTQDNPQELLIDVVPAQEMKETLEKAIEDLIANGLPADCTATVQEFKASFIDHFQLDTHKHISLVANRPYDMVINSGTESPAQLAKKI